jgi:hypothetical protein
MSISTADFSASSWSVGRGYLRLHRHGDLSSGYYWMGEYIHPRGVVTVYRQDNFTRMDLLVGGRLCSRSWARRWGDKTISRLAREFVEDVFG